jgi:hypothetical protein
MSRNELKEIIVKVIEKMQREKDEGDAPTPACLFGDNCDATTKYGMNEEG